MLNVLKRIIRCCSRRLLALLPVLLAAVLVAYLARQRAGPDEQPAIESVRTLRVIKVPTGEAVPAATGYGVAEPARIWEAVAEVKGTVSDIHSRLGSGELIDRGEVLIEIDPEEYLLAVERMEAGVEEIEAKLEELDEAERYTKRLLAEENRLLALARNAYERKRTLLERNVISEEEEEREETKFLQQKKSVVQLEEKLSSIVPRRRELNAALKGRRAELKQARIDLGKTTIKAPFAGRLGEVKIEFGQFVGAGSSLFSFYSIDTVEVEARFRSEQLRPLIRGKSAPKLSGGLTAEVFKRLFADIKVQVSQQSGDWEVRWEGDMDRIRGEWDPETRDLIVVVRIDRPYERAVPGERPPLMPGAFCQVRLSGSPHPESVILPRSALHGGDTVYVLDEGNRLRKREVEVKFKQVEYAVIESGLSGGETVIVSDPAPAIEGMKVGTVTDEAARRQLLAISRGVERE